MAEWLDWVGLGDVTVRIVDPPHIEMSGIYSRNGLRCHGRKYEIIIAFINLFIGSE